MGACRGLYAARGASTPDAMRGLVSPPLGELAAVADGFCSLTFADVKARGSAGLALPVLVLSPA